MSQKYSLDPVKLALVFAAAIFLIAFLLFMFASDYRFIAALFMSLVIAVLAGIILYLCFGSSGSFGSHSASSTTSHSGASSGADAAGPAATEAGTDAERQEAGAAAQAIAERRQADEDAAAARKQAEADEAAAAAARKKAEEDAAAARRQAEEKAAAEAAERKAEEDAAAERSAEERAARARAEAEAKAAADAEAARKSAEAAASSVAPAPGGSEAATSTPDYDGDGIFEGTNEGTRPAGLDGPRNGQADDLKQIKGVGPKLEKLCNTLGFWHFDQVASWTDDEVAWVDANLQGFKGRVSRDDWVGQARILASGGATEFSKRVEGGDVY